MSMKEKRWQSLGEMGLDFYYDFSPRVQQKQAFSDQLALAARLNMPVVVHTRDAFDDTLAILKTFDGQLNHVVLHCFTGTAEQAKLALDQGYYISFSGVVTFKNAHSVREAALCVPLDRLMIETDSPYLKPRNLRPKIRSHRNEPRLLPWILGTLAACRNEHPEALAEATTRNARAFFRLC